MSRPSGPRPSTRDELAQLREDREQEAGEQWLAQHSGYTIKTSDPWWPANQEAIPERYLPQQEEPDAR